MQTRQLGNSDLHITPLGLGTWAIGGGGWANGWGSQDDQESIATIKHALGLGPTPRVHIPSKSRSTQQ